MFLLDTNIVSELRKARPHGGVRAWLDATPPAQTFMSTVTLGELQAGVEKQRARDPVRAGEIEAWIDQREASIDVLVVTGPIFRRWARLMHGKPDELYEDAMIAATALEHGLTVVTRNVRDFKQFDVPIVNPFEARAKEV